MTQASRVRLSALQRIDMWNSFVRNHRKAIAAMDFFAVPTITFGMIYCFFVISHDRRHIFHFNVTKHRQAFWLFSSCGKPSRSDRLPGS
ncbi:MAG TPA: hypothetical protein VNZ03_10800 [Terriglobales bacterium]|nr:hypothetical protein [Terriglobales bacterium]